MIEPMGRKVDGQTSASIDKTAQASKSPDRCIWEDSASAEEFMQKLPQFDQEMSKKRQTAEDARGVLRFVGVVDMVLQKGEVKLQTYKNDHTFAQLSGANNIIVLQQLDTKLNPK